MMKKYLLPLIIGVAFVTISVQPTEARMFASVRQTIEANKEFNNNYRAVQNVIKMQNEFCNKREYDKLYSMYKQDFINNDGFSKEAYFKLVKETWKSYPDISYSTAIKSINLMNDYATVEVYETAVATSKEDIGEGSVVGELHGTAHSIYHLQKTGIKWKIISENILSEKTALTYGDARYLNITLNSPEQIGAGKSYSATLSVDAPQNAVVIASIGQEKITYPQSQATEAYRKLSDDNTLSRIFTSNKDNANEYNIAAVGITRAEIPDIMQPKNINIFLSGIAFVMTRVNVVPENKFINLEVTDEQKTE